MEELVMKEFVKDLFCNRYYWVEVSGIFHESLYITSPQQLYFTSLAIPIPKNDIAMFMKAPSEFIIKALQDMHPEMRGFMICEFHVMGWYSSDEFINAYPVRFGELVLKLTPKVVTEPKLKGITVIYRIFNENILVDVSDVGKYIADYIKYTLGNYMELSVDIKLEHHG